MATMNFSIPDAIKENFNAIFVDQNKSHLIAELMLQAIEEHHLQKRRIKAIDSLLSLRTKQKPLSMKTIQQLRKKGRP